MITLITLTQGNPVALQRTIDNVVQSFGGMVNDVVIGELCVFNEDRFKIHLMTDNYKELPFNFLYQNGFGNTLNLLSQQAKNDLCLYMNVGEIIESNLNASIIHPQWNCYKFNHATDPHQWIRMWNRQTLRWSGLIHEEVIGQRYVCNDLLFTMADTEKDNTDPFYTSVMNDIKELVYFNQYLKLVEEPYNIGSTNGGWVKYANDNYQHIKDRMLKKGARYEAFIEGDLKKYLDNCSEFEPQQNSDLIHFQ